jgi:predicted transcriptional regulator
MEKSKGPQKFYLDEVLERVLVIKKIDQGIKDAKAGKTVSHDKVKELAAKWANSPQA